MHNGNADLLHLELDPGSNNNNNRNNNNNHNNDNNHNRNRKQPQAQPQSQQRQKQPRPQRIDQSWFMRFPIQLVAVQKSLLPLVFFFYNHNMDNKKKIYSSQKQNPVSIISILFCSINQYRSPDQVNEKPRISSREKARKNCSAQ